MWNPAWRRAFSLPPPPANGQQPEHPRSKQAARLAWKPIPPCQLRPRVSEPEPQQECRPLSRVWRQSFPPKPWPAPMPNRKLFQAMPTPVRQPLRHHLRVPAHPTGAPWRESPRLSASVWPWRLNANLHGPHMCEVRTSESLMRIERIGSQTGARDARIMATSICRRNRQVRSIAGFLTSWKRAWCRFPTLRIVVHNHVLCLRKVAVCGFLTLRSVANSIPHDRIMTPPQKIHPTTALPPQPAATRSHDHRLMDNLVASVQESTLSSG